MNTRTFRAMNTEWWLGVAGRTDRVDLAALEATVHAAEAHYSRFLRDSALSRLNRERRVRDEGVARIIRRALDLHEATGGAFDVRVGSAMDAAGYDRTFDAVAMRAGHTLTFAPPAAALHVAVRGDDVRLSGPGTVDLGGIAKGWTVDRVAEAIEAAGCRDYLVDGGGDIRAAGRDEHGEPWLVGAGEGLTVRLDHGAVCTSSTRRRRWRAGAIDAHHIIDPATGAPSRHEVEEAVVVAYDTTTADALATTIIAAPERGLAAVLAAGAEALVLRNDRWEMTEGMHRWLI